MSESKKTTSPSATTRVTAGTAETVTKIQERLRVLTKDVTMSMPPMLSGALVAGGFDLATRDRPAKPSSPEVLAIAVELLERQLAALGEKKSNPLNKLDNQLRTYLRYAEGLSVQLAVKIDVVPGADTAEILDRLASNECFLAESDEDAPMTVYAACSGNALRRIAADEEVQAASLVYVGLTIELLEDALRETTGTRALASVLALVQTTRRALERVRKQLDRDPFREPVPSIPFDPKQYPPSYPAPMPLMVASYGAPSPPFGGTRLDDLSPGQITTTATLPTSGEPRDPE